ncbi:MAG: helix-turn-helix domain-containing protein [Brevinema sp.]
MKIKLILGEKLRDLRDERKLKLADVSEATGIPVSTLQLDLCQYRGHKKSNFFMQHE